MMLRGSVDDPSTAIEAGVSGETKRADALPAAVELVAFAEAVHSLDPDRVTEARSALALLLDGRQVADAAAVLAWFHAMDRIADGGGIELDAGLEAATSLMRVEFGIDRLA